MFQLEHYDISRTLSWIFSHFWKRSTQNKKPLVWTEKAKTIAQISGFLTFVFLVLGWMLYGIIFGIIVALFLLVQPYILITLSLFLIKPYEIWNRAKTIRNTRNKIASFKHTKVIGIAASYGKTSVKDILYHLLSLQYKVLKTPLSYNTIFGIAQVVDLELDDSYDFFICELGEFQPGDISEMCDMVLPAYGIMTGINNQHLERFKKIEHTTATVFELFDYLIKKNQKVVANVSNPFIMAEIQKRNAHNNVVSYGTDGSESCATNIIFGDDGSRFNLHIDGKAHTVQTPLLGNAHINNILGACVLSYQLGISLEDIVKQLVIIPKVPHRFEQTLLPNGYLLVDNSYSSNSDSFREALEILKQVPRKYKILVTPGMVELGSESDQIHTNLGYLADQVCTKLLLVGKSSRTQALAQGISKEKVIFLDDIRNLWQVVGTFGFSPFETTILIENDLPDNY